MNCKKIQKSLDWCLGTPELPGIRNRIFYIEKKYIMKWPELMRDDNGNISGNSYVGSFVIAPDSAFHYITILGEKSQLTSEAQGEQPNQTQLNKLVGVLPYTDDRATMLAAYLNNTDCIFIAEDMAGHYRVIGSPYYHTKATVTLNIGQNGGETGSTTMNIEAPDIVTSPFYNGEILQYNIEHMQIFDVAYGTKWISATPGAYSMQYDKYMKIYTTQSGSNKYRGDIKRTEFFSFSPEEQGLFCFRITNPWDIENIIACNIILNVRFYGNITNEHLYSESFKNNTSRMYKLSDGSCVFVYDLKNTPDDSNRLLEDGEIANIDILSLKIADIQLSGAQVNPPSYNFYWFHTFKNYEHLEWFITKMDKLKIVEIA